MSSSLKMKYDDCPYHCVEGKIFDDELRDFIPCPHCSEKRKELANEGVAEMENGDIGSLPSILGINSQFLRSKLVYDAIIPEGEKVFLEPESLDCQKKELEDLYTGLSIGQLPERSYCFGLGNKGMIDRMAYPILARAYLSGLRVSKFISCSEYNRMCINMDSDVEDYFDSDFVMMLIPDGASKADIASAKGLMQTRALKGKPTVFVTDWVIEACSILLGYYEDTSYFLARGVFVSYKVSKNKKKSHYINQLTGVNNDTYNGYQGEAEQDEKSGTVVTMEDLFNI